MANNITTANTAPQTLAASLLAVQGSSAASFINSIGVNGHINSGATNWSNTAVVQSEMSYLGVTNLRDGAPLSWDLAEYVALAKAGIKFDLEEANAWAYGGIVDAANDTKLADALVTAVPGSVLTFEGMNEYEYNNYTLNGVGSYGDLAWGLADDQQLQAAVKVDPLLAGVKIIAASTEDEPKLPNVGPYVDIANYHVYAGNGLQLENALVTGIATAQASAPGKLVYITETGISSSGYGTSLWGATDDVTQGIIDTNAVLDGFKDGAAKTFLYELMDETGAITNQNNSFGLFNAGGTIKPAAIDVHNLTSILADKGATSSFTPGTLNYTLSGLPSTATSMLLEKSDGTFDIVIWNDNATVSNGTSDVTPPTSNVTLSIGSASTIKVYDPMQSSNALQTKSGASSIAVNLAADPVILEINPVAVSPLPPPSVGPVTGSGSDTLVLNVSEDAYLGDAQFAITIDGQQLGGTFTATASHGAGATETFTFEGDWAPGTHTVGVDFLNDSYAGTPSTDRNLYVNSATYDGSSTGKSLTLLNSGTQTFTVQDTTVPPDLKSVTVSLSNATIITGGGDHMFFISGHGDTFNLSGGIDTITDSGSGSDTFVLPSAGNGSAIFNASTLINSDVFDLTAALRNTAWTGSSSMLGSYLHTQRVGSNTELLVSPTATSSAMGVLLATFKVSNGTLSTILAHSLT